MEESKRAAASEYGYYPQHQYQYQYASSGPRNTATSNLLDTNTWTEPPRYSTNFVANRYSRPPPRYSGNNVRPVPMYMHSPWHPRNWSTRKRIAAGVGVLVLLILIIVPAAVVSSRSGSYPDYFPLHYHLKDTFIGESFFDNFEYFIGYDPAGGFVHYSNEAQCQESEMNLTYAGSTSAVLRVDTTQSNASTGRHSARVFTNQTYNDGLFIFDVAHTPYGCATWPAVWLVDQYNWPKNGEIDVIEAVNNARNGNQMTLHTDAGCTMQSVVRKQTGQTLQSTCLNSTDGNAGCGVRADPDTFGVALNQAGGGVYAMELRAAGIRMWFFPRNAIPTDISNLRRPQPNNWGEALADFPSTSCDINTHFRNLSITIDIDVCGQWAGKPQVYSRSGCPGQCSTFAALHPQAFNQAFWEFNSIRVYQAKNASQLAPPQ